MNLPSHEEADHIVNVVTEAIVCLLAENITTHGFTLWLPRFGIFSVVHKPSRKRRIPLTAKVQIVEAKRKIKFRPLSELRELEQSLVSKTGTERAHATR